MKIFIDTLGCPKNVSDSDYAQGLLEDAGHVFLNKPEEADAIIVNTCGFIQDAKLESIHRILELAYLKKPQALLIISGCLSKRYGEDLYKDIPEADIIIGVNEYPQLAKILEEFANGDSISVKDRFRLLRVSDSPVEFMDYKLRCLGEDRYTQTLRLAEGCNNSCSYCSIPTIRGKFRSRPIEDLVSEGEFLAKKGTKELILIAQDVTFYGYDLYGRLALTDLLRELCRIEGINWIRLMYCYEDRISDELIELMAKEYKICKYIDMPIQHLSDNVLMKMGRRSSKDSIFKKVEKLREAIPGIHIRTTIITGFPGESEEDFDELLEGIKSLSFERLGVFSYSREEDTLAGAMKDQVSDDLKDERKEQIMRAQMEISLESNRKKIGSTIEVLVEGIEESGLYYGRTSYDAPDIDNSVIFSADDELRAGDFVQVRIEDAFDYDLTGRKV